ncbi:hypothetical protein O9G_002337 [Rozella allomycis CSF55]|uniref:D-lactate dehydratase n=1 Tax=Rozella allomycis (strain CSF55) TaxID=988480 RepID=A0A075B4X5_ROZAC|nr:hypothetical protein O9G_002337 [Rozella allomycis CSF55]|eukprot:EPZ36726.1 hypothetical protein O9G_002337 [Rozella allomycis CSF55]
MTHGKNQIVMIMTNTTQLKGSQNTTGFNAIEAEYMQKLQQEENMKLVFASPRGGECRMSPRSKEEAERDPNLKEFIENNHVCECLKNTKRISELNSEEIFAVVLIGGHGCLIDFPQSNELPQLLQNVWYQNRGIIGAIGQGSIALLNMKSDKGQPFLKSRRITCMSNEEEKSLKEEVPYYVEEKLESVGARVETQSPFKPNVIVEEERLISGQNPQSSHEFSQRMYEMIKRHNKM